jgi:BirA family biotin operon repressor/biotin-[acetyl-CoA-carboxylase] ligase
MGQSAALMERFRIHHFESMGSTQIEAKKMYYGPGDIITADMQTASYGRRGRTWQAPIGNLFMTMVEEKLDGEQFAWLGYAVGLALYDAIHPLLKDQAKLNLKWPNDLIIDGQKMSGILLEVESDRVLIGIGVNVSVVPRTDQPVTCINDHAKNSHQPTDILQAFLPRYQHWFEEGKQHGFPAMRKAWLSRAAYINEVITARLADGTELTGVFNDIDQQGALVLQAENRHYTVTAADIYSTKK